jgi:hypothetical protein
MLGYNMITLIAITCHYLKISSRLLPQPGGRAGLNQLRKTQAGWNLESTKPLESD